MYYDNYVDMFIDMWINVDMHILITAKALLIPWHMGGGRGGLYPLKRVSEGT